MGITAIGYGSILLFGASLLLLNLSELFTFINWTRSISNSQRHTKIGYIKNSIRSDKGSSLLIVCSFIATGLLAYWLSQALPQFAVGIPYYVYITLGAVLLLVCMAVRRWSVHALGPFFTHLLSIREGHTVIKSGPYRYLRHPSYAAGLLAPLGFGIAFGNWISILACILIPVSAYVVRITIEERMLVENLGKPYLEYKEEVGYRLLPWIW